MTARIYSPSRLESRRDCSRLKLSLSLIISLVLASIASIRSLHVGNKDFDRILSIPITANQHYHYQQQQPKPVSASRETPGTISSAPATLNLPGDMPKNQSFNTAFVTGIAAMLGLLAGIFTRSETVIRRQYSIYHDRVILSQILSV